MYTCMQYVVCNAVWNVWHMQCSMRWYAEWSVTCDANDYDISCIVIYDVICNEMWYEIGCIMICKMKQNDNEVKNNNMQNDMMIFILR